MTKPEEFRAPRSMPGAASSGGVSRRAMIGGVLAALTPRNGVVSLSLDSMPAPLPASTSNAYVLQIIHRGSACRLDEPPNRTANAEAEGKRESPFPGELRGQAFLLAGRHGLGALSSAEPRRSYSIPGGPGA